MTVPSRMTNISALGSTPVPAAQIEDDKVVGLVDRQHCSANPRLAS